MSKYTGVDNLEVMTEAIKYNRYLVELVSKFHEKNNAIVDFGAGTGTFAKALADLGYKVTCIEPDDYLSEKIQENKLPVRSNIRDLQEKVQTVYSLNVLEHIVDDVDAINSIYQALKPGGLAVIYVPAFEILFTSMDKKVGHCRRYKRDDLSEKMEDAGFQILSAKYVDSLGFIATLLYKMVGNKNGDISRKSIIFYDRFIFPISKLIDVITFHSFGKNIVLYAKK